MPAISDEMLYRAVKEAVNQKIIPKQADLESYMRYWTAIKQILEVAINGDTHEKI